METSFQSAENLNMFNLLCKLIITKQNGLVNRKINQSLLFLSIISKFQHIQARLSDFSAFLFCPSKRNNMLHILLPYRMIPARGPQPPPAPFVHCAPNRPKLNRSPLFAAAAFACLHNAFCTRKCYPVKSCSRRAERGRLAAAARSAGRMLSFLSCRLQAGGLRGLLRLLERNDYRVVWLLGIQQHPMDRTITIAAVISFLCPSV